MHTNIQGMQRLFLDEIKFSSRTPKGLADLRILRSKKTMAPVNERTLWVGDDQRTNEKLYPKLVEQEYYMEHYGELSFPPRKCRNEESGDNCEVVASSGYRNKSKSFFQPDMTTLEGADLDWM